MIAVTVNSWRSESLEELERSERESDGTIGCGMGEAIDDAFACCRTVPVSLEAFEGEGKRERSSSLKRIRHGAPGVS